MRLSCHGGGMSRELTVLADLIEVRTLEPECPFPCFLPTRFVLVNSPESVFCENFLSKMFFHPLSSHGNACMIRCRKFIALIWYSWEVVADSNASKRASSAFLLHFVLIAACFWGCLDCLHAHGDTHLRFSDFHSWFITSVYGAFSFLRVTLLREDISSSEMGITTACWDASSRAERTWRNCTLEVSNNAATFSKVTKVNDCCALWRLEEFTKKTWHFFRPFEICLPVHVRTCMHTAIFLHVNVHVFFIHNQ